MGICAYIYTYTSLLGTSDFPMIRLGPPQTRASRKIQLHIGVGKIFEIQNGIQSIATNDFKATVSVLHWYGNNPSYTSV